MTEVNIIDHALIKLSETGGFYTKALEKWNGRLVADKRKWVIFRTVIFGEYERMLTEGAGTRIQQEGYGTAFHAKETMSDEESLTETIVKYAERASLAESRVSKLGGRLSVLEMDSTAAQAPPGYAPQPPPHTSYFAPRASTFQAQQPPQKIALQPPPHETQWMPAQQQQWVPQRPRQSGGSHASDAGKRRKKKGQNYNPNGHQWLQNFGSNPNVAYNQHNHGGYAKLTNQQCQTTGQQGQHPGQRHNQQQPFGNNIKEHHNLMYCFTCG